MSGRRSYVQWQDWHEWQDVHVALFSNDLSAQQRALARVAAWRSRAQLPVAISATAQLLEIQLHERMAQHHHHGVGVASRSHMELSLQYASAVVRCVNGLVDGSQKGAYAMAVSSLAQRIGIPLWIVDLRHESTHNQMPSLPVLRFAAQHLLSWLRANYWFKQEELLRSQVRTIGDALQTKIGELLQAPSTQATAAPEPNAAESSQASTLLALLDVDKVRNVVVPLLVSGTQYSEQIAPTGLLFTCKEALATADTTSIDDVVAQYPRDALAPLLLEIQTVWRSFGAWLLAHLCRRVFVLNCSELADDEDHSVAFERQVETEICLLWIKFLVANEWREKLKFAVEPVDDLYHAGAEMLCQSEELKPTRLAKPERQAVFERLQTALRSCKGIRTHPLLTNDAAIQNTLNDEDESGESEDTASAAPSWRELPVWTGCPLGMRSIYGEIDSQLEYGFELDSLDGPLASCVFAFADEHSNDDDDSNAMDDGNDDARIDALMSDLDAAYDARVAQALSLKDAVVQEVIREGQSVHQKLLPQDELQRIQDQIEIW